MQISGIVLFQPLAFGPMKITLTFDNGPHPEVTPHVLDLLARHGIAATFFVLGRRIAKPELRALAQQAFAAGHRVGNHSFYHETAFGEMATPGDAVKEIDETENLLAELAGPERLFRPFGNSGKLGPHLLNRPAWDRMIAGGYTCVLWNQLAYEWENPHTWLEPTLARIASRDWTVSVLHDIDYDGAWHHLDEFVSRLKDQGAEFVQDFPDDCVPLRKGVVQWNKDLMPD
jgi:peptidoglycan/xylan/chitin deacetylase (PgdA/CDA1 family)